MNKQELKEQVSSLPSELIFKKVMVNKDSVLGLIDQLDEPKKVTVPKVAIDYYEEYKNQISGFDEWFGDFYDSGFLEDFPDGEKLAEWLYDNTNEVNRQRELALANLIVNGPSAVEVEQEKLYTVEVVATGQYLVERYKKQGYVFIDTEDPLLFTKSELEIAGFGWVFECNGVKVEEVE